MLGGKGRWMRVVAMAVAAITIAAIAAGAAGVASANAQAVGSGSWKDKAGLDAKGLKHGKRIMMHGFVLNNDTFDEAKAFTIAGIDYGVASLESIKERVLDSNMSLKEEIIAEIDSSISALLTCRDKVESASTVEELREAIREVRETWREARLSVQKTVIEAVLEKIEGMLERGEKVETFVEEKISEFENEGKDVTLLQNWLDNFREDRAKAIEKVQEAKEKVMGINSSAGAWKALKEIREDVRNAVQQSRECMKDLREIIRLIKEYGDQTDVDELMEAIEEVRGM